MTVPWFAKLLLVLMAPAIGALLMGLDRKLTARIQGRVGPSILQPFYDVLKLFLKEPIAVNQVQIVYAIFHLAFMALVVVLLVLGQDMLMILFVHAAATIALILGGMSVRSPYSRIGSQRKILQMAAYEPVFVLMVIGIYLSAHPHSFLAGGVAELHRPLLFSLPLVFLAFFAAVVIKMDKSPFDVATSHHAHQELVRGVTLEYAGPYLGLIHIAHFFEVFAIFAILAMFWSTNLAVGLAVSAACFVGQIVVDNACARLTSLWMVRFMWTGPLALALTNVVWLYLAETP